MATGRRRWWPRIGIALLGALLLLTAAVTYVSTDRLKGFGGIPGDEYEERFGASPQFSHGIFVNAEATGLMKAAGGLGLMRAYLLGDELRTPACRLPMVTDVRERLAAPPPSGLRITWLGHSTTLFEIDGQTVLTDPMWSDLASPSSLVGVRRFHPPPLPLADVPHLDAVVISHDHYDHLDMATIRALSVRGVPFHVAIGVGVHLRKWGVPAAQIFEHDWWESVRLPGGLEIVSTPARHFSGRGPLQANTTLWTSWSLVGPAHRVFVSGDTGMTQGFKALGEKYGPFDVALIEIGQWNPSWGDIHLGPRGALEAFAILNARRLLPIHWATFRLALHDWSEPAETLTVEAAKTGVHLLTPLLGEPIEPTTDPATGPWWRALPPMATHCPT